MLIEQTIDKLHAMKLNAMAAALREQMQSAEHSSLPFEDRLSLLVDRQWDEKESRGLSRRLQLAKLKQPAAIEDIDFATPRGLDRSALLSLAECEFIRSHRNVIITGPTGVGKTYIACAIANKACRLKHSVRYIRTGSLLSGIALARADGSYPRLARALEKTDLLVLDDWGLYPLEPEGAREIFEILEDRSGSGSTMIASQLPVSSWFDAIAAPTIADAILDRLIHGAYRVEMTGESMRKTLSALTGEAS
jgi:DNA replication protein DnaC